MEQRDVGVSTKMARILEIGFIREMISHVLDKINIFLQQNLLQSLATQSTS